MLPNLKLKFSAGREMGRAGGGDGGRRDGEGWGGDGEERYEKNRGEWGEAGMFGRNFPQIHILHEVSCYPGA